MNLRTRQFLLVTAATCVLTSCASFDGIDSNAQQLAPARLATGESLPSQGGQWPDHAWPSRIGGASLQSLIDEALLDNPGLQVAAARVAAARALADAADVAADPGISASFKSTYQRFSENGMVPQPLAGQSKSDNRLALDFSYDFDFWGKHDAALRAAVSSGMAAEAEQEASRLVLSTSIARAWVELARQYAQLELVEQQLQVRQHLDRLTQLRISAGLETQSSREQARLQLATLRAEQAHWQESVALTRNQIAALMGQGPDRGLQIEQPVLPQEAVIRLPDQVPLALLGRRPDIVAARWRVEAARGDIDVTRAQFYPNVNLLAFAGFSSLGLPDLLHAGSRVAGIGPVIHLPVFETGTLRARLKGRVAAYDAAVGTYNQTLTEAVHDVADQVQSLRAAQIQDEQRRAATQAAANSLSLAEDRARAGTTSMIPVLSTRMAWLAQRKAGLDAQARRADLQIGLIKALGGGYDVTQAGLADHTAHNKSTYTKFAS